MTKAKCKVVYDFHPYSEHFELLDGDEKAAFAADIKAHGLFDPVTLYQEMILDGRNRSIACDESGIECRFVEFKGTDEEALALVKSRNLHRRHSTKEQRAFAAAKLATLVPGRPLSANLEDEADGDNSANLAELPKDAKTQKQAAAEMDVSVRDLQRAKKVIESGSESVQKAVVSGDVSLSDAAAVADLPKSKQNAAVTAVKKKKARTLKEASRQIVTGDKSSATSKPKPNEKPTGPFAKIEKLIGQLSRAVDELANEKQCQGGNHVRGVHNCIDAVKARVLEWKRSLT